MRLTVNINKSAGRLLLAAIVYLFISSAHADPVSFSRRVVTESGSAGIPNLTVSLTPPTTISKPKMVTTTDNEGRFTFNALQSGRYFLEVSQGPTVLYNELVEVPEQNPKEIRLSVK